MIYPKRCPADSRTPALGRGSWCCCCLEQDEVVGQVDPQLVLVFCSIRTQAGMAQGQAQILEEATLYLVIQTQVAFPLLVITASDSINIAATQVLGGKAQARHVISKVVVVLTNPSLFTGAFELADLRVGDQVSSSTTAIVQEGKVAVATHVLVTQTQCMVAAVVGEHRTHGAVIHFTASSAIAVHADGAVITVATVVGASGVAVEIAQVGNQLAFAQWQGMHCAQVVLLVVVLELGEVIAGDQVVTQLGITADILEFVDPLIVSACHCQAVVMAPVAAAGFVKLTGTQGDVIDLVGGQHGTAVGLRQQATIVTFGDRQVGFQTATDDQLGIGHLGLAGKVDLAEFTDGAAIVFQWELVTGLAAGVVTELIYVTSTRIQTNTRTGKHIHTKTDRTLGVA